jgi:hypothetical protein
VETQDAGKMKPDKSYQLGAERLVAMFRGEMMTLGFNDNEIIEAVITTCDPDYLDTFNETRQQLNHLKEIIDA